MQENLHNLKNFSVIILAAGMSRRMGVPKLSLKWDKYKTLIEQILAEYNTLRPRQIIVVLNNEVSLEIKKAILSISESIEIIINEKPERGRFSSLKAGINALSADTVCFIQNIDNPFVSAQLMVSMMRHVNPESYVVPVYKEKRGHPVLLGSVIIKDILKMDDEDRSLSEVLKKYNRLEVETDDEKILVNINTAEEYKKYFKHY